MRYQLIMAVAGLTAMVALMPERALSQSPKPAAAAKAWTQPKTPWGDPDLQGTWTSDDCIGAPMNRPANLGDRAFYTEQELADREKQLERQRQNDLKETVDASQRVGTGPPGHWGER